MIKKYNQYIKENNTILSDIKINVNGGEKIINKLIEKLTIVIKKKKIKNINIKSIDGFINKEKFTLKGNFYSTYLEIILNNKDKIIGEYSFNNIKIQINNDIVYDLDNEKFDNEVLVDKIVDEYIKKLKERNNKLINY